MNSSKQSTWRILFVLGLCATSAVAQSTSGNIVGTVYDATGATVSNASVVARSSATGVGTSTVSTSSGQPSERGLYQDGDAAYADLLKLGYAPEQIILHGESLGTAVAVNLAVRKPCTGLILEAPLKSLRAMAGTILPFVGPLLAHGFDTESKISRVHAPLLLIHGDADEIVPFSQGQAVFQAANQPKQFWPIPGANHNDLLYKAGPEYKKRVGDFYRLISRKDH